MTQPPEGSVPEGSVPPPYPAQLSPEMTRGYLPYGSYSGGMPSVPAQPSGNAYAHWGLRVAATFVDGILGSLIYYPVLLVLALTGDVPISTVTAEGVPITAFDGTALFFGWGTYPDWFQVVSLLVYLAAAVFIFWNTVWRQGRTGSSIGKSLVRIQVIDERTGAPIGAAMTFVRSLCHLVDALPCYLGYLWPLWDKQKQTFSDKMFNTYSVRA